MARDKGSMDRCFALLICALVGSCFTPQDLPAQSKFPLLLTTNLVSDGLTTAQVNVGPTGANIPGDAANEPSLCVDPLNPDRLAVGWRQFTAVTNSDRQAGWAFSTNGGLAWTFPGVLQTNVFRSDPVLAADAEGRFYYLSLQQAPFRSDLWVSADAGVSWDLVGPARGGDKPWMAVDTTSSPGRGNIYEYWSPVQNTYGNRTFSRSTDGGESWSDPIAIPAEPYWGTLDINADGWLYLVGWSGDSFWVNRSMNAPDRNAAVAFDLTRQVDLGGNVAIGLGDLNPQGLVGQPWIAVDRSSGPTRGTVYVLCSVVTADNRAHVMFARSTDGARTWSAPQRINDDLGNTNALHWFGTLAVSPGGRVDACWYDTRHSPNQSTSELFYSTSYDGGLTWSANRPLSGSFNHRLGYPVQRKIGDYIAMSALDDRVYIAYTATFNLEEDIFLRRLDFPVITTVEFFNGTFTLSWRSVPGASYVVEFQDRLGAAWAPLADPVTATGPMTSVRDPSGEPRRFYRVLRQL